MLTSPIYDNTRAALRSHLPDVIDSQIDTLALTVVGITTAQSAQMAAIARAMPLDTTQMAKEQRIRRLLDNERITLGTHYQPIARSALSGLKGQRVNVLIDRVLLRDHHNILVISVGFRRRSIPLAWKALEHRGASGFEDQVALLENALSLLPEGVRVTVHADSEFRTMNLFNWIRAQGHNAMLGITGATYVYDQAGEQVSGSSLEERVGTRTDVVRLSQVYLTHQQQGPVNVLAWWDKDDDGKPLIRAVMTNLPADGFTYRLGKRRMWIETVFRDWQSGGFHLDKSGLKERERFARLLLLVVIAYIWLLSIGRWVVKKGYRRLIDDGGKRNWHYSLFQLGVGWMKRLQSYTRTLPILLYLYI
jgi:hypothetical protein